MKIAITTVSCDDFIEGTKVLFHSLKKYGHIAADFMVIDVGLSLSNKQMIQEKFNCKIIDPSASLFNAIQELVSSTATYENVQNRFYSLESFNLAGYDRVIYFDSDMMCVGELSELVVEQDYAIGACADHRFLQGFIRSKATFKFIKPNDKVNLFPEHFIDKLFNTGLMLINKPLLNSETYQSLVQSINLDTFKEITTGHTDTVILNRHFLDQVHWLNPIYNCYLSLDEKEIKGAPRVIHFIGKEKPWKVLKENKWHHQWRKLKSEI
jgi:lipopolysaccharide biosynthesis glycosyltransferase